MSERPLDPTRVIPEGLGEAVGELTTWFVIGGHAVRCFCPYRPSHDVDFGVRAPRDLEELLAQLGRSGELELLERGKDTVHLLWSSRPAPKAGSRRKAGAGKRERAINVSIFVLDRIAEFVEERRLSVTGILATKLHAILDRGTRRDFFDLYVTLQHHRLGIVECLDAIQRVYRQPVNQGLLLRALTYFDDAEREARLPGEGPRDLRTVKEFFTRRVGDLLVPPVRKLAIQSRRVDVR